MHSCVSSIVMLKMEVKLKCSGLEMHRIKKLRYSSTKMSQKLYTTRVKVVCDFLPLLLTCLSSAPKPTHNPALIYIMHMKYFIESKNIGILNSV